MSVLLTKYNAIEIPKNEPISITYQLDKRCKTLPNKITIAYFIKVLDMQGQYREAIEHQKQLKEF